MSDVFKITLILHQATAKQNRSNVEEDTLKQHDYSTITSPDTAHYSPQGITECASSSEESLKEITPPPTSPRVEVKQPARIITSQLQETVMKQECNVIVRWRDFIPLILLLIVSLVCQSDRELDDRSH